MPTESSEAAAPAPVSAQIPASTPGPRSAWIGIMLALASAGAFGALWLALAPKPRFEEAEFLELAGAGEFEAAEDLLRARLTSKPPDPRASFLLAQLLLERPDRGDAGMRADDASEALELLDALADVPSTGAPDSAATRLHYRGKAEQVLKRWDAAERAWIEALRIDPLVPEAGFALLDLYYIEGRRREAQELALRLHAAEPDPRDRALIMLALLFQDAVKTDANSLVPVLEAVALADPSAVHAVAAYGLALIRAGDIEKGLDVLKRAYDRASSTAADSTEGLAALKSLLAGLDQAGRADELQTLFDRLPESVRDLPALARYRGLTAQRSGDWERAIAAYEAAHAADPSDFELLALLAQAQRMAGRESEADDTNARVLAQRDAQKQLLALHDELSALSTLGVAPHPEPCERVAALYDILQRAPEAKAWRAIGAGASP